MNRFPVLNSSCGFRTCSDLLCEHECVERHDVQKGELKEEGERMNESACEWM